MEDEHENKGSFTLSESERESQYFLRSLSLLNLIFKLESL